MQVIAIFSVISGIINPYDVYGLEVSVENTPSSYGV